MGLRQEAHDLFYSIFDEEHNSKNVYTEDQLRALRLMAEKLSIFPKQVSFSPDLSLFKPVIDQFNEQFSRGLLMEVSFADKSKEKFLWGIEKGKGPTEKREGIWEVHQCSYCNTWTIYECIGQTSIKSRFDYGQPGRGPSWHTRGCEVVSIDVRHYF